MPAPRRSAKSPGRPPGGRPRPGGVGGTRTEAKPNYGRVGRSSHIGAQSGRTLAPTGATQYKRLGPTGQTTRHNPKETWQYNDRQEDTAEPKPTTKDITAYQDNAHVPQGREFIDVTLVL